MMEDQEKSTCAAMSRRALALATGAAALGVAISISSATFALDDKTADRRDGQSAEKRARLKGKAGRIKVDVASDGSASVDVRCAEGESMEACADLTRDVVDRIRSTK